jgi:ornithine carbamoyltransferase
MLDAMMIRTFAHATLTEFATHSTVPVINGLSDDLHPCQLMADMQTFQEHRGSIAGKTVAWVGDGNNMVPCQPLATARSRLCHSPLLLNATARRTQADDRSDTALS